MGCCASREPGSKYIADDHEDRVTHRLSPSKPAADKGASPAPAPAARPNVANYQPKKPKLDPKDFQFVGCKDQVLVKAPGSINGQAFTIDNCENCDLYVLDHCAQVNIDECKNCRIFIGPCSGSIFLRSSTQVECAFITRQLRLRDVTDASISLLCRTRPIIESSSQIRFGCYSLNYTALPGQIKAAKLDTFHNFWWWPYDFTPKPDNWSYLPAEEDTVKLLGGLPEAVHKAVGDIPKEGEVVVTWGERPNPPGPTYMFALFAKKDGAMQFINQAKHQGTILTTNGAVCNDELLDTMAAKAGWPRGAERTLLAAEPCVGVELRCEADVARVLGPAAHVLGGQHTSSPQVGALFHKLGLEGAGAH